MTTPHFIDPALWGPSFWQTMHWTAAGYPTSPSTEDKIHFKSFYEGLRYTLPCSDCRQHYTDLLLQMPIDPFLVSGRQLRQWVVSLHNAVNSKTSSDQRWTIAQADQTYIPADPSDSVTIVPPQISVSTPVPSTTVPIVLPPVEMERWRKRQQQLVVYNNARSMGRVLKPAISVRRTARSYQHHSVAPRGLSTIQIPALQRGISAVKPKKKGCGCNKKK